MAPLIILFIMLAYLDMVYTQFMLERHGVGIELNPVIPWLAPKIGLANGVFLGIAIPSLLVLYLGIHARPILELITLGRLYLFFMQAKRLWIELATFRERPRTTSRREA